MLHLNIVEQSGIAAMCRVIELKWWVEMEFIDHFFFCSINKTCCLTACTHTTLLLLSLW